MKLRKYMVYLDDGAAVYRVLIPAVDEDMAIDYVSGNGEVVAVKDVTSEYEISSDKVRDALKLGDFDNDEILLIIRTLEDVGVCL